MNEYAIIGGDKRLSYLAKLLKNDNKPVYCYGTEKIEGIQTYNNIQDTIEKANIVISSIPFSKNGDDIYAPFSEHPVKIEELINQLRGKKFFAGSISNEVNEELNKNNIKSYDIMKQEDLTILNTIATAEGTIKEIIENTQTTLHSSKVLILGFGRVAKTLAKKLKALDAEVTTAARKETDFSWMDVLGYKKLNINKLSNNLNKYDIIINTVPYLIMNKDRLKYVKEDALLIDLASKPGGFDENACNQLGLNFIWALAIPGKIAPITTAEFIKNTIYNILEKEKE